MAGCFDSNRKRVFLAMQQCLSQQLGYNFTKRTMLTSRLLERAVCNVMVCMDTSIGIVINLKSVNELETGTI